MRLVRFNSLLSQSHVALKVVFYINCLLLASTLCRLSGKMGRRLKLFISQPFTSFLPHFGNRICYLEQNQTPNDGWLPARTGPSRQAYQPQPQVARVWLVAGGNFPPCSHVFQMLWIWIQLVTLLHVIPARCRVFPFIGFSSFFPHSLHRSTNRSTAFKTIWMWWMQRLRHVLGFSFGAEEVQKIEI